MIGTILCRQLIIDTGAAIVGACGVVTLLFDTRDHDISFKRVSRAAKVTPASPPIGHWVSAAL